MGFKNRYQAPIGFEADGGYPTVLSLMVSKRCCFANGLKDNPFGC